MKAWHFTNGMKLSDGRRLIAGKTYKHKGNLDMCRSGLHASVRPLDALDYAPGSVVSRVECGGEIVRGDDKIICSERKVLWAYDAEPVLRKFARLCALDVIDKWDAPRVVVQYLKTGDESLRAAAWEATCAATRAFAWAAVRAAMWAATQDATQDAAREAAQDAVRAVAWGAVWDIQNKRLARMLNDSRPGGRGARQAGGAK